MNFSTDTRQEAFKRTMKLLGKQQKLNRRKICKLLTKGNEIYKNSTDASSFLKDVVNDQQIPIERDGNSLTRTDIEVEI